MLDLQPLFSGFVGLQTSRLLLRPVTLADAPSYFGIMSDPGVVEFFGAPVMESAAQAEEACRAQVESFGRQEGFQLALELRETGEFIGLAGFWRWVKPHFRGEIGYQLARDHWGQCLMVEALMPILLRGFACGVHAVEANIHPANHGSRRVLEKLGFKEEGFQREWYFENGAFADNVLFGLRADELDGAAGLGKDRG